MKKYLFILFLLVFVTPSFVFAADSCNTSKVSISSLKVEEIEGKVIEEEESSFHNKNIGLHLRFFEVGDMIHYSFKVKNDANFDFEFDANSIKNDSSSYLLYRIETDDNSLVVRAGEEKEFQLYVTYDEEVPSAAFQNSIFESTQSANLALFNDSVSDNPKTGRIPTIMILAFVLSAALVGSMIHMKKSEGVYFAFFLLLPFAFPLAVKAVCGFNIEVMTSYTISKNPLFCVKYDGETNYYEFKEGMSFDDFLDSDYNKNALKMNSLSASINNSYIVPYDSSSYRECNSLTLIGNFVNKTSKISNYNNNGCYQFEETECSYVM